MIKKLFLTLLCGFIAITSAYAIDYDSDFLTGGTPTASSAVNPASNAVDNDEETYWYTNHTDGFPGWWKYDLGVGITKTARKLRIRNLFWTGSVVAWKDFKLYGSNNDSDWTEIISETAVSDANWQEWTFVNATAYRYYKLENSSSYYAPWPYSSLAEVEMMEAIPERRIILIQ